MSLPGWGVDSQFDPEWVLQAGPLPVISRVK